MMARKDILDLQSECISIARTVSVAFERAMNQTGTQPITTLDLRAYTLFYHLTSGVVAFDLNWDQGDAFSPAEQQYCRHGKLIVAGYFSQYEISSLNQFQLGERIYQFLKLVDLT
ncbi:hypothetical protein [Larkinella humicola]|uniref:Uncharacterized protein n=1 Tax=Larkinella humicola TaxID=2607654 RepID=A0A5N1JN43_9BACT|nr:hypothetical protein [Larkinella humicola]KAA9357248.1 hypothetical protein F0P93_05800 [Larkinella humicola]